MEYRCIPLSCTLRILKSCLFKQVGVPIPNVHILSFRSSEKSTIETANNSCKFTLAITQYAYIIISMFYFKCIISEILYLNYSLALVNRSITPHIQFSGRQIVLLRNTRETDSSLENLLWINCMQYFF